MLIETIEQPKLKSKRHKPLLPYKLIDRLELPAKMRVPASFEDYIEPSNVVEVRNLTDVLTIL